jgi:hypothetical protein
LEIFIKKITLFLGKNSSFLAIFYTLLWKTLQVGLKHIKDKDNLVEVGECGGFYLEATKNGA